MAYPQAPWTLKGYAIQTLQLIDIDRARPFIPKELDIISVWPGKTLGGVYVSSYGLGSVLEYNELIVVAGVVNYSGKIGGWVSHIYVDNSDSVAGGREIWGLPKELAEFIWVKGEQSNVTIRQGDRQLCSLTYSQPSFGLPIPFSGPVLSSLGTDLLLFKGEVESRLGLINSKLIVPAESPFSSLNLGQPWLSVYGDDLRLVAGAPQVVGNRSVEFT
ncbi:acetoacetate decarboxylase family protein [Microseira wollei]|uniref:Acetoacetate decarboxylase n=1 Tax=Microseira wollei NIES-4236 TaxID=2530354 RepID=A0AAV3X9C9_9CYAN|nr:acetoacetate decarboxylase family protein [Microseira wollei]GET37241.1 acetoacetate decarboxylase [Microseira wollei NIES-4236]